MTENGESVDLVGHGDFSIGSNCWPGTSKVIEEMGEALQVLGKVIATHGATDHWDGSDLRERLIEELGDVLGAMQFWQAENLDAFERIRLSQRAEGKRRLFETWHYEQAGTGGSQD